MIVALGDSGEIARQIRPLLSVSADFAPDFAPVAVCSVVTMALVNTINRLFAALSFRGPLPG